MHFHYMYFFVLVLDVIFIAPVPGLCKLVFNSFLLLNIAIGLSQIDMLHVITSPFSDAYSEMPV